MNREVTSKKLFLSSFLVFSIIILDQATKALAVKFLPTACNVGFAFGVFPFSNVLSAALTFAVLVPVMLFLFKELPNYSSSESSPTRRVEKFQKDSSRWSLPSSAVKGSNKIFALALIFGGGLSNLIDRFTRGCVVDFIDVDFWPSFNLADAAITVGVIILVLSMLKTPKNHGV